MTELTMAKVTGALVPPSVAGSIYFALTDAVAISAITSAAAVIMAGVSAYLAYRAKVVGEETHKVVNSRMTEFMDMAKKAFTAQGVLQGKAEEKAKQSDIAIAKSEQQQKDKTS